MTAELKFNLEDLDDRMSHLRCIKSLDLCLTIYDILNIFRNELKYNDNLTDAEIELVEKLRGKVYDSLNKNHVIIDELIN